MKRRFLILCLGITIGFGTIFSPTTNTNTAYAVANQELESQKEEIQSKKSQIESQIDSKQGNLEQIQSEKAAVEAEIKRLDLAVADTSNQIREQEKQIEETEKEIERLKEEIEILKERIKKRDELLKDRMRSIQESGGMISYLDVLIGAQSFSDFVNRVSAVSSIVQADKDILQAHQDDKELLEKTEAEVKEQLAQLEKKLDELEAMKKTLKGQINEKNEIMSNLKKEEEHEHAELSSLEDEAAILASQEKAIQQAIVQWEQRQKELEAERKRQEAEAAAKVTTSTTSTTTSSSSSTGSSSGSSSGSETVAAPTVTSGNFMKPTSGRLSSNYGSRWGSLHAGIDIANSAANVPVVSAADGIVFRSYYSSSYGNVVFVTHNIDGQVYTTVYAHLESRSVGAGQSVKKGSMIGYMGNTGNSFGKHLHFELHKGPWNGAKSNSVDPRPYIGY